MSRKAEKISVENVNVPGSQNRVDAEKYNEMKTAMLKVLPGKAPGFTHAEMCEAVKLHLADSIFPNGEKVAWWSKTVQLDLEAKGILSREASKPLRWHKT